MALRTIKSASLGSKTHKDPQLGETYQEFFLILTLDNGDQVEVSPDSLLSDMLDQMVAEKVEDMSIIDSVRDDLNSYWA